MTLLTLTLTYTIGQMILIVTGIILAILHLVWSMNNKRKNEVARIKERFKHLHYAMESALAEDLDYTEYINKHNRYLISLDQYFKEPVSWMAGPKYHKIRDKGLYLNTRYNTLVEFDFRNKTYRNVKWSEPNYSPLSFTGFVLERVDEFVEKHPNDDNILYNHLKTIDDE